MTSDEPPTPDPFEKIALGGSKLICDVTPEEFKAFSKKHNTVLDDKVSRAMLAESGITVGLYGAPVIGLIVDNELVSVNVTAFGKGKRKNAWGRYLNCYLAYTAPQHRYKGYATILLEELERRGIEGGWNRIRSLAGSYAGVRLHLRFGHQFWGIAKKGELIVDSPLRSGDQWPYGIPERARTAGAELTRVDLMNLEDIARVLWNEKRFGNVRLPSEAMANYIRKERR